MAIGRRTPLKLGADPVLFHDDLIEVLVDRLVGPSPAFFSDAPAARRRIAAHEVGHALVPLSEGVPIRLLTIRAGREARGLVLTGPGVARSEIEERLARIRIGYGGMIAEQVAGLGSGAGNSSDTAGATGLALSLIEENGLGTHSFNLRALAMRRPPSEELLSRVDEDAGQLLDEAYWRAEQILFGVGQDTILHLAEILAEREWLTGPAFEEAVKSARERP